ncbi:MAG TPA: NDP-sugar synthase [Polyangia bacterium]|nr:NDP-sugar synthase [Polyangia bacterium]
MLLAAGRSTRLGALGERLPKPLVPICGYPAIRFGLQTLLHAGLRQVVVNLHHHAPLIRQALGDGRAYGAEVTYSDEAELLGTGGGLAHAHALLGDGPVVVMNAKVVCAFDLGAVMAAHHASGADATLVVRDDPDARGWGAIAADASGRIVSILGQPEAGDRPARPVAAEGPVVERMFTGIQIVGPSIRARLRPVFCDTVRDGYIPALRDGADLRVFVADGYFAEHSTPERYLAGNLAVLREPGLVPFPPGPLQGIDPSARLDATAQVTGPVRIAEDAVVGAGARVGPDVVLGAGARVAAGVHLTRTVVWPGVSVTQSATGAVCTPDGVVPIESL